MRFNSEGWLERTHPDDPPILLLTTERTCRQLDGGIPRGLVNHYTAVEAGRKNMIAMCKRTEKMAPPLTQAEIKAGKKRRNPSWNFLLCMDGLIVQCAPITRGTFHVVGSGNVLGKIMVVNSGTLGMEIENAGQLYKIGSKFYQSPIYKEGTKIPDPKQEIPATRVFVFKESAKKTTYWTMYTGEQQLSAAYLYATLMVKFNWTANQCSLTHRQFNAPRKVDPGEAWTIMHQPAALAHAMLLAARWKLDPPTLPALPTS